MSNELRNFLTLPYGELEELNLKAKEQRQEARCNRQDSGGAAEISDRREAYQGGDGAVQRSGRPPAHAGLRQEVSGEELGQPDLRRLVDSRLHGAEGERSCGWASTGAPSTGRRRIFSAPGKVLVFGEVIDKDGRPYAADMRGVLKSFAEEDAHEERLHAERRQRDRRLSFCWSGR